MHISGSYNMSYVIKFEIWESQNYELLFLNTQNSYLSLDFASVEVCG